MRISKSLRNEDARTFSQNFRGGLTENAMGTLIPESNSALVVGKNHSIRSLVDNISAQKRCFIAWIAIGLHDPALRLRCEYNPIGQIKPL